MIRKPIASGWYGEALLDGSFAVLLRGAKKVLTHTGPIDTAGEDILYLRCWSDGQVFKMAGQASTGIGNVEYSSADPTVWNIVGDGYGENTVLYLRDGSLVQGAPKFGSQGLRYQADDGSVVTADQSHLSPDHKLADYTTVGDVVIGQNQDGSGAVVQIDGVVRLLEPGDCQFIRVTRGGDNFAIAVVKMPENQCVLFWATREDLAKLPVLVPSVPPVEPPSKPPVPPVPPTPEPKVPPTSVNHSDIVAHVASSLTPNGSLAGNFAFIDAVRAACPDSPGFVKSSNGAENTIAYGSGFVRTSRLIYPDGHLYKLIADAGPGGANTPEWADEGMDDPGLFVLADQPGPAPAPAPTPTPSPIPGPAPVPPPFDPSTLLVRLDALEARLASLADRPAPDPTGREVSVSGKVAMRDIISSRLITWSGKVK